MRKQTNLDGFTKHDLGVKSLDKCTKVECSEVGIFATILDNVCNGTFITLKPIDEPKESQVFTKDYYERSDKKYCISNYSGTSEKYLKGNKVVYINFNF